MGNAVEDQLPNRCHWTALTSDSTSNYHGVIHKPRIPSTDPLLFPSGRRPLSSQLRYSQSFGRTLSGTYRIGDISRKRPSSAIGGVRAVSSSSCYYNRVHEGRITDCSSGVTEKVLLVLPNTNTTYQQCWSVAEATGDVLTPQRPLFKQQYEKWSSLQHCCSSLPPGHSNNNPGNENDNKTIPRSEYSFASENRTIDEAGIYDKRSCNTRNHYRDLIENNAAWIKATRLVKHNIDSLRTELLEMLEIHQPVDAEPIILSFIKEKFNRKFYMDTVTSDYDDLGVVSQSQELGESIDTVGDLQNTSGNTKNNLEEEFIMVVPDAFANMCEELASGRGGAQEYTNKINDIQTATHSSRNSSKNKYKAVCGTAAIVNSCSIENFKHPVPKYVDIGCLFNRKTQNIRKLRESSYSHKAYVPYLAKNTYCSEAKLSQEEPKGYDTKDNDVNDDSDPMDTLDCKVKEQIDTLPVLENQNKQSSGELVAAKETVEESYKEDNKHVDNELYSCEMPRQLQPLSSNLLSFSSYSSSSFSSSFSSSSPSTSQRRNTRHEFPRHELKNNELISIQRNRKPHSSNSLMSYFSSYSSSSSYCSSSYDERISIKDSPENGNRITSSTGRYICAGEGSKKAACRPTSKHHMEGSYDDLTSFTSSFSEDDEDAFMAIQNNIAAKWKEIEKEKVELTELSKKVKMYITGLEKNEVDE